MIVDTTLQRIPILMFHSVSSQAQPGFKKFALAPERFEAQLHFLKLNGYTTLTVNQLIELRQNPAAINGLKPIVLTFDDGFTDFSTQVLPLLRQYGMTATVYVVSSFIGKTSRWLKAEGEENRPILTWEQLAEISAAGIEIGAHSRTHAQLDILDRTQAEAEIAGSKDDLESGLGRKVCSFAYPFGYNNAAARKLVKQAGYQSACAVRYGFSSVQDDPFALSRLIVTGNMGAEDLDRLLYSRNFPLIPLAKRLANPAWRFYRYTQAKSSL